MVLALQIMKGDLAAATLGSKEAAGPGSKQFSRDELRQLFTLTAPDTCETKALLDAAPAAEAKVGHKMERSRDVLSCACWFCAVGPLFLIGLHLASTARSGHALLSRQMSVRECRCMKEGWNGAAAFLLLERLLYSCCAACLPAMRSAPLMKHAREWSAHKSFSFMLYLPET